jgi:sulfur carrier protein
MPISVNGVAVVLPETRATLEELLVLLSPQRPFAVAHNHEFVPSSVYAQCEVKDGDEIDIVHPSAGG